MEVLRRVFVDYHVLSLPRPIFDMLPVDRMVQIKDDRLAAFFPEFLPDSVSAWLAGITVRDLLTMRSGYAPSML